MEEIIIELAEALKWYIENDDANEEDTYYMAGQNRAREALKRFNEAR